LIKISSLVSETLLYAKPIVALESALITHGLPFPENYHLAKELESIVKDAGAVPATIAVLDGDFIIGVDEGELLRLAEDKNFHKISSRELSVAEELHWSGGTTVAGTLTLAFKVGIKIIATGGIGGVHRNAPFDISADLPQLSKTPLLVVCAGAKSILDLPATIEYLETWSVPILGYKTSLFPSFFSISSGLFTMAEVESAAQIARIAVSHWRFGFASSILVTVPPPKESALPDDLIEKIIDQAVAEAESQNIRGQAITPFLLKRVNELSSGDSMRTNLSLLRNNVRIAAEIAVELSNIKL